MKKTNSFLIKISLFTIFCLSLFPAGFAQEKPSDTDLDAKRTEALKLVDANRYLDAFPILEKIAPAFPKDAELWAHFGIAIMQNAITSNDPETRKKELVRGLLVLNKAKQLGTKNVVALNILDQIPSDSDFEDNLTDENPEVSKALREGEAFFGRGEYDKAFAAYEKAYKLNPKSYEAVLFMGDSLYAQKKFKESEPWFAKAAGIDPNREQAHRFWGDALLFQKKYKEALDKYAEAMIAEPFSRMIWNALNRWAEESGTNVTLLKIAPPGNEAGGEIKVDEAKLKAEDGTIHWKLYNDTRRSQVIAKAGKNLRHTLADEAAAWRKVAEAARRDIKAGKIKYPDQNLVNLIKIDDAGLLEPYILILRAQEDFSEDFLNYREKNRLKLKQFIIEYMLDVKG
ncbi:MAG TPA: tetratricopeptide repeat protein [Pyrinomonadaceae bacterium]|nr:tetratricopeptide repeat protein [Pyrinomonadaceae bacterium]